MSKHADIKLLAKTHNNWIDHSPGNKNMHIKQLGQALTHLRKKNKNIQPRPQKILIRSQCTSSPCVVRDAKENCEKKELPLKILALHFRS